MTPVWQLENGQYLYSSCSFSLLLAFILPSTSVLIAYLYYLCRYYSLLPFFCCKALRNIHFFPFLYFSPTSQSYTISLFEVTHAFYLLTEQLWMLLLFYQFVQMHCLCFS